MRTPSKHKKSAGVAPGFKKILASLPSVLFTKSRFGYKFETGWTFTGNVSQTTSIIIVQFCGRPPRGGVDEIPEIIEQTAQPFCRPPRGGVDEIMAADE